MKAWKSPWPQWRSHWHVLHAWPISALVLALLLAGLCSSVGLSWVFSDQAWQDWWQAEEESQTWQTQLQALQAQVQAHQARIGAMTQQAHPSGLPLPAWAWPAKSGQPDWRNSWQQLAQAHGLQTPPALDDHSAIWVGPLPHLLAAWQRLPEVFPQHTVDSFELTAQPGSHMLALSVSWSSWADQTALRAPAQAHQGSRQSSAKPQVLKVSLPPPEASGVLHNPFAVEGLRQALPEAAHTDKAGALRGVALRDLRWLGMLQQGGQVQALVAHAGLIQPVHTGQALGQDFGEVVQIAPDHLVLREWHANALGQWQPQTIRFPDRGQP